MVLYQLSDGYCYNSDTLFLYNFVLEFKPTGNLLDIGSGSGVLGLLIARDSKVNLTSVEVQKDYVYLSKVNAKNNNIEANIIKSDFLQFQSDNKFDYIVSNPPFYDSKVIQSQNKKLNIARYNNNLPLDDFINKVNSLLKPRGYFIFCYDSKQLQNIVNILTQKKIIIETIRYVYPKIDKDASLVMIQARKGSKSLIKVKPPLIVFNDKDFSDEVKNIYKKARTHSIKCQL